MGNSDPLPHFSSFGLSPFISALNPPKPQKIAILIQILCSSPLGYDRIEVLRNRNQNPIFRASFRFFSTGTRIFKSQFQFLLTGTGILKCQSGFLSTGTGISATTGIPVKNPVSAYPILTLHPKLVIYYTFIHF